VIAESNSASNGRALPDANIARHLAIQAAARPDAPALKVPKGRTANGQIDYLTLSFAELDAEVSSWVQKLTAAGLKSGDRTLVMVKPGLPLIAAVFALFRMGAVPVVIDPGMGMKSFLGCVARTRPRGVVGIAAAILLSRFFWRTFRSVRVRVPVSGSMTARVGSSLRAVGPNPAASRAPTDLAAILFTSGSTGAPKGVVYEHGMFDAQVGLIQSLYSISPGEVDLPILPIFALFNPALGMTTVVPEIDPRRPAAADPAKVVQAIRQEQVTNSFGSPTLWRLVADYCAKEKVPLPSLRRVLCAGAPVPHALWEAAPQFLMGGVLHSPYGATEALPVATIAANERKASTGGSQLGRPVPSARVKVIAIRDEVIETMADAQEMPAGQMGEIIVSGPMVTREYDGMPEATRAAKIYEGGDGCPPPSGGDPRHRAVLWHRMGDCGYFDSDGMLWFCGRKVERVISEQGTFHTEPSEQPFRAHPAVKRCALVGLGVRGAQIPAIVIEPTVKITSGAQTFVDELRALGRIHPTASVIRHFFFYAPFPVDVRHNAKIHRMTLTRWANRNQAVIARD
jgi:acyl-CoA synthetase (AMP-forming)/AMP-acid ligase II